MFRDTFLETIKMFGCDRCMLDSDFPVCKIGLSYTVRRRRLPTNFGHELWTRNLDRVRVGLG